VQSVALHVPASRLMDLGGTISKVRLAWNDAVQVHRFESAARSEMVLCEVPGNQRTARYALPAEVYRFASAFDGRADPADLIARYAAAMPSYTPEQLRRLVRDFLQPRGLLMDPGDPVEPPVRQGSRYMVLRIPLFPPPVVNLVGRMSSGLYSPACFIPAAALILIAQVWFFGTAQPGYALDSQSLTASDVLAIMLLMSLGSLFHEFGHAAAGYRYGCRKIQIGCGIYLYFNVLYADLSEAWRLPRVQRAIVDAGGMYFQALFLVGIAAAYAGTGSETLLYCFLFTNLALAMNLNPVLRLDGYWLVSDLSGIANLRGHSALLFRRGVTALVRVLRSPQVGGELPQWHLGRGATLLLATYTPVSVVFLAGMWFTFLRGFAAALVMGYPGVAAHLWRTVLEFTSWSEVASATFNVFWRTTVIIGITVTLFRALRWIVRMSRDIAHQFRVVPDLVTNAAESGPGSSGTAPNKLGAAAGRR
jgi:putative peptide zinc metalloprotease protein